MKNNLESSKGITIVSLIVTIIILIILAGVSISAVIGENGLITIAKKAKENMEMAQIEEQAKLNELYTQVEVGGNNEWELDYDAIAELTKLKQQLSDILANQGVESSPKDSVDTMLENIEKLTSKANSKKVVLDYRNSLQGGPVNIKIPSDNCIIVFISVSDTRSPITTWTIPYGLTNLLQGALKTGYYTETDYCFVKVTGKKDETFTFSNNCSQVGKYVIIDTEATKADIKQTTSLVKDKIYVVVYSVDFRNCSDTAGMFSGLTLNHYFMPWGENHSYLNCYVGIYQPLEDNVSYVNCSGTNSYKIIVELN